MEIITVVREAVVH